MICKRDKQSLRERKNDSEKEGGRDTHSLVKEREREERKVRVAAQSGFHVSRACCLGQERGKSDTERTL